MFIQKQYRTVTFSINDQRLNKEESIELFEIYSHTPDFFQPLIVFPCKQTVEMIQKGCIKISRLELDCLHLSDARD